MPLHNFETYQLALQFHSECRKVKVPSYLRDQLLRAASSVALNLAEGSAKPTRKDQLRFYAIAFASLRESQAALDLSGKTYVELKELSNRIASMLYRLNHPKT